MPGLKGGDPFLISERRRAEVVVSKRAVTIGTRCRKAGEGFRDGLRWRQVPACPQRAGGTECTVGGHWSNRRPTERRDCYYPLPQLRNAEVGDVELVQQYFVSGVNQGIN